MHSANSLFAAHFMLRRPAVVLMAVLAFAASSDASVTLTRGDKSIRVEIDGALFTEYVYKGRAKPVLYPVVGPHGVRMTRDYPFKKGKDEASDHPHQASLWYTHGDVNGVSFWHVGKNAGKILNQRLVRVRGGLHSAVIESENKWVRSDGKVVCTDRSVIGFSTGPNDSRIIDYAITLKASHGDLKLGDTKEGSMGIRTHPRLRVNGKVAKGHALNSAGHKDKSLWGKSAAWVCYWAPIDGHTVGVAILDHPSNPRHPTTWHARDYGLIAANPFGLSRFKGKKHNGDMTIKSGGSITFKYRFIFHKGDAKQADIAGQFETWAGGSGVAGEGGAAQPASRRKVAGASSRAIGKALALGVVPGALRYDQLFFEVHPNTDFKLTFANNGLMPHNVLITAPGKADAVLYAAMGMGADGAKRGYVPDSRNVLHATRLLKPGESQTLAFRTPRQTGEYPYLCTFPGHGFIMRGIMRVKAAGEALASAPKAAIGPPVVNALEQSTVNSFPQGSPARPYVLHTFMPSLDFDATVLAHHERGYPARKYSPNSGKDVKGTQGTMRGLPAAIGVNFGKRLSYCWDTVECRLLYGWRGDFMDMTNYWGKGTGDKRKKYGYVPKIRGKLVHKTSGARPLRIGSRDTVARPKYRGYRLVHGSPEFRYDLGSVRVREHVQPGPGDTIVLHFRIDSHGQSVYYVCDEITRPAVSASAGSWFGNALRLSATEAKSFVVTVKDRVQ